MRAKCKVKLLHCSLSPILQSLPLFLMATSQNHFLPRPHHFLPHPHHLLLHPHHLLPYLTVPHSIPLFLSLLLQIPSSTCHLSLRNLLTWLHMATPPHQRATPPHPPPRCLPKSPVAGQAPSHMQLPHLLVRRRNFSPAQNSRSKQLEAQVWKKNSLRPKSLPELRPIVMMSLRVWFRTRASGERGGGRQGTMATLPPPLPGLVPCRTVLPALQHQREWYAIAGSQK